MQTDNFPITKLLALYNNFANCIFTASLRSRVKQAVKLSNKIANSQLKKSYANAANMEAYKRSNCHQR